MLQLLQKLSRSDVHKLQYTKSIEARITPTAHILLIYCVPVAVRNHVWEWRKWVMTYSL